MSEKHPKLPADRPGPDASAKVGERASLIIGVGASAGAIESLERYIANLSLIEDQASVLVLQHREVLDEQRLQDAFSKREGLRLAKAVDGALVEGGNVYLFRSRRDPDA